MYALGRKVGLGPDKQALRASRDRAGAVSAMLDSAGYQALIEAAGERRKALMHALVYGDAKDVPTIRARIVELDWIGNWAGDVVAQGRKDAEALEKYE